MVKGTLFESRLELFAVHMLLYGAFLLGHLGAGQSTEQEILIVLVGWKYAFVLGDIKLSLWGFFVGFGVEVGQQIFLSGQEFMFGDGTLDFAVLEGGELVLVLLEEFVELVEFFGFFAVGLFGHLVI